MKTMNTQEIRADLLGFLRRLQQGEEITVLYRSKPYVRLTTSQSPDPKAGGTIQVGSAAALQSAMIQTTKVNRGRKARLDTKQSYKDLYRTTKLK